MGAPTWPPTPEDFYKETMKEQGLSAQELGLQQEEDEEAERALLAQFLFEGPRRQVTAGEDNGTTLNEVRKRLEAWLRMVTGADFAVGYSNPPSTDGNNLFLPKAVPAPYQSGPDEVLYRAMGLVQLGFANMGFLENRRWLGEIYTDWVLRSINHLLVARYVVRHFSERFPGIKRDFEAVQVMDKAGIMRVNVTVVPRDGLPEAFLPLYEGLTVNLNWRSSGPDGEAARAAVAAVDKATSPEAARLAIAGHAQTLRMQYKRMRLGPPPLPYFVGIVRPEWLLADLARDLAYENEWKKGAAPLRQLLGAMAAKQGQIPVPDLGAATPGRKGLRGRLKSRIKKTLKGTGPDLAEMPAYGAFRDEARADAEQGPTGPTKWESGTRPEDLLPADRAEKPGEDGSREYDEWDYKAGYYKVAEVKVFTPDGLSGPLAGYDKVVEANQKEIKQIRRQFEALRVDERWVGGLIDGPEIDLNRAITAITDIAAGQQPDDRFYRRFVREREEVCVLTLVDQSGSTQGQVLHQEQEALILFAEGLKTLGLPHAFYGFNGNHAQDCQLARLKGFDEYYTDPVKKRLGNLRAQGASRLGAYVRHATWLLQQQRQARKVMLLLSDGKPEDRDTYRGTYGIKDTAMAVQEALRAGIHLHCISLDGSEDAVDYLTEIFGANRFLMVRDVSLLPVRLPEVFRGLIK